MSGKSIFFLRIKIAEDNLVFKPTIQTKKWAFLCFLTFPTSTTPTTFVFQILAERFRIKFGKRFR